VAQGGTQGPLRTLDVAPDGNDLVLDWLPVVGATSYRIYRSLDPTVPRGAWPLLSEIPGTGYRDVGAVSLGDVFYSVVALGGTPDELVDLSLVKDVDDPAPAVGDEVVFTLTVSNAPGVQDAGRVRVTDRLPDGYAFVAAEGDVDSLQVRRELQDVVLSWQAVDGAASYRVYALDAPDAARNAWTLLADVPTTEYTDVGAVGSPDRFYLVRTNRANEYDPVTGVWEAGTVGAGASRALEIVARALGSGNHVNEAEVTAADQPDLNDVFADGAGDDHDTASVVPQ
jgi:uncharacterized repeat protein (TIGR01451 family)